MTWPTSRSRYSSIPSTWVKSRSVQPPTETRHRTSIASRRQGSHGKPRWRHHRFGRAAGWIRPRTSILCPSCSPTPSPARHSGFGWVCRKAKSTARLPGMTAAPCPSFHPRSRATTGSIIRFSASMSWSTRRGGASTSAAIAAPSKRPASSWAKSSSQAGSTTRTSSAG